MECSGNYCANIQKCIPQVFIDMCTYSTAQLQGNGTLVHESCTHSHEIQTVLLSLDAIVALWKHPLLWSVILWQ